MRRGNLVTLHSRHSQSRGALGVLELCLLLLECLSLVGQLQHFIFKLDTTSVTHPLVTKFKELPHHRLLLFKLLALLSKLCAESFNVGLISRDTLFMLTLCLCERTFLRLQCTTLSSQRFPINLQCCHCSSSSIRCALAVTRSDELLTALRNTSTTRC